MWARDGRRLPVAIRNLRTTSRDGRKRNRACHTQSQTQNAKSVAGLRSLSTKKRFMPHMSPNATRNRSAVAGAAQSQAQRNRAAIRRNSAQLSAVSVAAARPTPVIVAFVGPWHTWPQSARRGATRACWSRVTVRHAALAAWKRRSQQAFTNACVSFI